MPPPPPPPTPTALLLVDVQPAWYSQTAVAALFPDLRTNVTTLLAVCRAAGVPVVHVRARYDSQGPWSLWHRSFRELHPDKPLVVGGVEPWAQAVGDEVVVWKPTFDGFTGTALDDHLRARGVRRVLVAGLLTSVCVHHTAHGAFSRGYEVELVQDCAADRSLARHAHALALYGGYVYRLTDVGRVREEVRPVCGEGEGVGTVAGSGNGNAPRTRALGTNLSP